MVGSAASLPIASQTCVGMTARFAASRSRQVRIAIVLDNFSPRLSTKTDSRVGDWARANKVELGYVRARRHGPRESARAAQDDPSLHRLPQPRPDRGPRRGATPPMRERASAADHYLERLRLGSPAERVVGLEHLAYVA